MTYAETIRTIASLLQDFCPEDARALLEAALKVKRDQERRQHVAEELFNYGLSHPEDES